MNFLIKYLSVNHKSDQSQGSSVQTGQRLTIKSELEPKQLCHILTYYRKSAFLVLLLYISFILIYRIVQNEGICTLGGDVFGFYCRLR